MVEKLRIFYGATSPEKLQFNRNDGYRWVGLGTLSSKMVDFSGKLAGDGLKMAKTVTATRAHALPTAHIAHCLAIKLQP